MTNRLIKRNREQLAARVAVDFTGGFLRELRDWAADFGRELFAQR